VLEPNSTIDFVLLVEDDERKKFISNFPARSTRKMRLAFCRVTNRSVHPSMKSTMQGRIRRRRTSLECGKGYADGAKNKAEIQGEAKDSRTLVGIGRGGGGRAAGGRKEGGEVGQGEIVQRRQRGRGGGQHYFQRKKFFLIFQKTVLKSRSREPVRDAFAT